MLFESPGRKLLRPSFILWALFALIFLSGPASAVPFHQIRDGLTRRADKPGMGVELEIKNINIIGPGPPLVGEKREAIKGAIMTPIGYACAPKLNWVLTAEVGDSNILPEAIVDGLKNKVGDLNSKSIGEQIHQFFKGWTPCSAKECKVSIKGFDNLGQWSVKWPAAQPLDLNRFPFGPQGTTAMPLGAVREILGDAKAKNKAKNPLASSGALDAARIKILTKKDFASFAKISPSDVDDEFLGFFSLLTSYCVLAKFTDPKKGPKHLLPVMPRTDFVAQYNKFIEPKLKKQLLDRTISLLDIVVKVSGNAQLATEGFKWNPGRTVNIPEVWADKAKNLAAGKLDIEDFINHIQGFDKKTKKTLTKMDLLKLMDKAMRHGQIGSLNNKMETVLGSTKEAPILEFRELDPVLGPNLGATLESYEKKGCRVPWKVQETRGLYRGIHGCVTGMIESEPTVKTPSEI